MEYASAGRYNELDSTLVTEVISDARGIIAFEEVRRGNYYIEVSFIGFNGNPIKE